MNKKGQIKIESMLFGLGIFLMVIGFILYVLKLKTAGYAIVIIGIILSFISALIRELK